MKARLPEGFRNKGNSNVNSMLKQAQKMQEEMALAQAEIEEMEFTASSGGGAVEVTVTGKKEIKNLKLKPEIVDPDDIEMLSDLIIAAVNEALRTAEQTASEKMEKISGGLNIPGLF